MHPFLIKIWQGTNKDHQEQVKRGKLRGEIACYMYASLRIWAFNDVVWQ